MTDPSQPLFLFGPGFSAKALAKIWAGPVFGTVRSETSVRALQQTPIIPVSIGDYAALRKNIAGAHLVISAPPTDDGCPAMQMLGEAARAAASVTYLSTTGVYGDLDGGWAMEWSKAQPQSVRARRRYAAEQAWVEMAGRLAIVRLPGIYGPGRSAFERLRTGKARRIVKPGQVFSRAHVDDIAAGLKAILLAGEQGVFNLCDDQAAPPQAVIAYAADLLKMAVPPEIPFDQAELSPMGQSFYSECKRVSNARLKSATGWRPTFPTYPEGLNAILAAET
ncbi:MAG: SDR family NAD(P)-dependent oxidoreductase [Pseudomonadota bacterium]